GLLVCSMDGTVAFLDFSQDELGDPLNEEEKNTIHQKMYGKSLAITMETQLCSTIIENPEMLKYQQETRISSGTLGSSTETPLPKLSSVVNGQSLEDIRKVYTQTPHT
ncbi:protein HIRA, partial [Silurus asotus]